MQKIISKVSLLKVGKINTENSEIQKNKEYKSAIKKAPINSSFLTKTGFKDDEVADRIHHGGENKALFFMSSITYKTINEVLNVNLTYDNISCMGENILVENIDENDVCIGDIWQIGNALIQITQPRQPCWKLSASTNIKQMTKFIFQSGLTGWYAKVLKEGEIKTNDDIILISRLHEDLSIKNLNLLMLNPKANDDLMQKAINCNDLGKPFKTALEKRYNSDDYKGYYD